MFCFLALYFQLALYFKAVYFQLALYFKLALYRLKISCEYQSKVRCTFNGSFSCHGGAVNTFYMRLRFSDFTTTRLEWVKASILWSLTAAASWAVRNEERSRRALEKERMLLLACKCGNVPALDTAGKIKFARAVGHCSSMMMIQTWQPVPALPSQVLDSVRYSRFFEFAPVTINECATRLSIALASSLSAFRSVCTFCFRSNSFDCLMNCFWTAIRHAL